MSDTPRTDAVTNGMDRLAFEHPEALTLMRTLERELVEAVSLAERLGEGLSYDSPERRAKDLAAFHEWQFNRTKR